MALVVFFRASNVGGHQVFRPGLLAKELADLDLVNIGAAGTFVVRARATAAQVRKEILRRLKFKPELIICSGPEVAKLAESDLFGPAPKGDHVQRYVTVMEKAPVKLPKLPIEVPAGRNWEIRVVRVEGRFALAYRFPRGPRGVYPNSVVEKQFGVAATTRNWNTVTAVVAALGK